jgi:malonyl-CoA/methylmalonyl-CoA synthetase
MTRSSAGLSTPHGSAQPPVSNLYTLLTQSYPVGKTAASSPVVLTTEVGRIYRLHDMVCGSARIAHYLQALGLPVGSRVAVQVEKSPEAVMVYLACLRSGMVFLPLNTAYRASEIGYFFQDASPALVVCSPEHLSWVEPLAKVAGCTHVETLGTAIDGSLLAKAAPFGDDFPTVPVGADALAAILYTSGTTGRSKGAMLTHGNLASNAQELHVAWAWRSDDVLVHALPIFHVHGLFVALHGALLAGARMHWLPRFESEAVLRALPQATVMMGVPTFYVRLLEDARLKADLVRGMRLFVSGSAPLLAETHTAFTDRTGHAILERYGMSETVMLTSNPYEGKRKAGTVGRPLPGVSLRLIDETGQAITPQSGLVSGIGGVQVRGPNVFVGYWNMPEKTREEFTEDGWFKTGDMGRYDEDGYVVLVGRSKDLIITGGYNVYPKEIEMLLDDLAGVEESAVIGLPHPDFGEAVAAVAVPRKGVMLSEATLLAQVKEQIANFKVPKRLFIVEQLPRNVMGKVQKNLLRDQYAKTFAAG